MSSYARVALDRLTDVRFAGRNFLSSAFAEGPTVSAGTFDGEPVWIVDVRPRVTLGAGVQHSVEGDGWVARAVVLRRCLPGEGPLTLTAITHTDRIAAGLTLEGLLSTADLTLPQTAVACSDEVMADLPQLAGVTPPVPQPVSQPPVPEPPAQPPADTPPVVAPPPAQVEGIPPPPADMVSWYQARDAGDIAGVLGFLAHFPDSRYADEARAWLAARAIVIPQAGSGQRVGVLSDPQAWAQAVAEGSAQALWTYLKAWPDGAHAAEARARLRTVGPITPAHPQPPSGVARK